MRKWLVLIFAASCMQATPITATTVNWHTELVDSGGGYWATRVAVKIENPSEKAIAGQAVKLVVGAGGGQLPLAGVAARSLRVVNPEGLEYLYRLEQGGGSKSVLSPGDAFVFAVDVPANSQTTYYIYADDASASAVTEYLDETIMEWDQETNNFKPMDGRKTPLAEGVQVQALAPERLALRAVCDLVSIPNRGGLRSTEIMTDPDAIYRVRQQVAEQILRLRKP